MSKNIFLDEYIGRLKHDSVGCFFCKLVRLRILFRLLVGKKGVKEKRIKDHMDKLQNR